MVVFGRYATDSLVTSVEQQNVILATFIANDLKFRTPQHFKSLIHVPKDLEEIHHAQHIKDIDAVLMDLLKSLPVLKVKAYRNDLTIYSTDHSQVGKIKSSSGFLKFYQEGIPTSKLTFRGEFNALEGVISNRNLIETYVPVGTFETMTGESSRLIIEIYTDVTPLVAEIEQSKVKLIAGLIFLFAALYGVLVLIVRRADRVIDHQYKSLDGEITERKQAEEALRQAKEEAELADRSKSEFLAHMSHELQTPLNSVIGFAEMLEKEIYGSLGYAKYPEYAKDIHTSGTHLLSLIDNILDISKIEAGELDFKEASVNVDEIILSSTRMVAGRAEQSEIALELEVPESLPCLRADELRLKQIIINLLTNAIKFTPKGGQVTIGANVGGSNGIVLTDISQITPSS